jgi:tetratricopeptide (TPR) repeat protein
MGASFELRRDMPNALKEYKKAVEKNPDMPGLHYSLGSAYWREGNLDKAEEEFKKELKIAPENYLATWKLGNIALTRR